MPMISAKRLREPEIKAALIDVLFAEGMIDVDTVVISEMPVASMGRRADIVVANGHLLGFEIKSDGDKTVRLGGQLQAYQKTFEGIVIVSGARHLAEILDSTPNTVGVVAVDQIEEGRPRARMLRKPHIRSMSIESAIRQMRVDDLWRLAHSLDINPRRKRDRYSLEILVRSLPSRILRQAALEAIKNRYRSTYESFKMAREKRFSTLESLPLLKRPPWNMGLRRGNSVKFQPPEPSEDVELSALKLNVRARRST